MTKVNIVERFNTSNGLFVAVKSTEKLISVKDIITDGQNSYEVLTVQLPTTPNSDEDVYIMLGVNEI